MGLDLGNLIGNLGSAYLGAKYGGGPSLQPVSLPGAAVGYSDFPRDVTPALGLPFADIVRDAPGDGRGYLWDPNANCGQGKWIKKRRRRHRNLATRGDIRDLSALKGVIGQGKLLEAWIATHS